MATKTNRTKSAETAVTESSPRKEVRRRGPSLNRVSLIGRVATEPQLRYTPNGIAVTSFRLATNGTEAVQFHTIIAWRGLAEIAAEYVSKGRLVYAGGRLKGRTWQTPDGTSRYALEIVADEIQFLTPKPAWLVPAAAAA
jgi:single-strand DNA-binding protein